MFLDKTLAKRSSNVLDDNHDKLEETIKKNPPGDRFCFGEKVFKEFNWKAISSMLVAIGKYM